MTKVFCCDLAQLLLMLLFVCSSPSLQTKPYNKRKPNSNSIHGHNHGETIETNPETLSLFFLSWAVLCCTSIKLYCIFLLYRCLAMIHPHPSCHIAIRIATSALTVTGRWIQSTHADSESRVSSGRYL